jgi:hypothetical protein
MRTWVLGFLLAVMALQSVWAGVAAYCQHRADVAPNHIGHHQHEHVTAAGTDGADVSKGQPASTDANPGSVDNDCGYCHLSHAQPLALAAEPWLGHADQQLNATAPSIYTTREPEGLERPNWRELARSASLEEPRIT